MLILLGSRSYVKPLSVPFVLFDPMSISNNLFIYIWHYTIPEEGVSMTQNNKMWP